MRAVQRWMESDSLWAHRLSGVGGAHARGLLRGAVEPAKGGAQRRAQCECTTIAHVARCAVQCGGRKVAWHGMGGCSV